MACPVPRTGWRAGSAAAWSTPATAPTSTPPRRCSTPTRCASGTGHLEGLKVTIVGDILHSRVARSNVLLLHTLGADVTLVAPPTLLPVGVDCWPAEVSYDLDAVLPKSDVVMMLRVQRERMGPAGETGTAYFPSVREYSRRYGLDVRRAAALKDDAIVMHPGPMVRGMEIASEVADGLRSTIVEQVANGVSVRMAVLYLLLGGAEPAIGSEK